MGNFRHHAILVSDHVDEEGFWFAVYEAKKIFGVMPPVFHGDAEGVVSFLIPPDGSKEGRDISNEYDEKRARFVDWLKKHKDENGCRYVDWIEIYYGDQASDRAEILNHSRDGK